ncbi:MAG: TonB-dependent receptor [Candidatus Abyssobacteria bacterium SURF_17]|uniref:TonB-dependent receptor n=1 Tax=Candidatus Abyssobacteria bacterium SURF_17 TaxID=2093361 RepID=A0A419EPN0_9BACT|nr:MAG: TonB-dependent receptor [Candidatus Abyssubacteria bacterium SURF_17]
MKTLLTLLTALVFLLTPPSVWAEEPADNANALTKPAAVEEEATEAASPETPPAATESVPTAAEPAPAAVEWEPPEEAEHVADFEVYTLGEILVTADKPSVREVSITNEVTAEDIAATNSRTAAEALSYVPGIEVSTGRKNEPEISIHGFEQRKTLILIDGVPYYETNYGKLDLNQIPSDIIAKIEVTKGAPSVLYGPNAEVGVINIITKKASEKPYAALNVEGGEKDYFRTSLSHGMKVGIFNYWLNYTHNEQDAWRLSDDFDPELGAIVRRPGGTTEKVLENGGFRNNSDRDSDSIWAKFGVEPNEDSEYFVNLHYIDTEKGLPPSIATNMVFLSRPAFSQFARFDRYDDWGVDLSGRQRVTDQFGLQGKLFYHNHVDDYVSFSDDTFTDEISTSRFKDYFVGGNLIADIAPVEWDVVRLAFHYKEDSHKERDDEYLPFAESESHTGSLALENEFNRINNLSVVVGISYDWFKVDDAEANVIDDDGNLIEQDDLDTEGTTEEFNPMIGAYYTFPDATKLYGSVAQKTRFPTLQQLFSGSSGNPDLNAEKSVNYTIGASRPFFDIAQAELAFFYHDIEDWISRDGPSVLGVYRNYAEIDVCGIEFNTEIYPTENLALGFGYTYLHASDESDEAETHKVVQMPKNKVDARLTYAIPNWDTRIDLTALFVDEAYSELPTPQNPDTEITESDDYYTLNARVAKRFGEHFEGYVAVNNITDYDYESEADFPAPGRMWWVGVTARY